MSDQYEIKTMKHHDALYFPEEDAEFYVPHGSLTKEVIEMYASIVKERAEHTLW